MKYQSIMRAVSATPWAILPTKLEEIMAILSIRAEGGFIPEATIQAVVEAARSREGDSMGRSRGAVAVMPILGVISPRVSAMGDASGGISNQMLKQSFIELVHSDQIESIVLDIDSPGGAVDGLMEFAEVVFGAREIKPVVAVANVMAASAAFWIATAASEFVASPGSDVGAIGTIGVHVDVTEHEAQEGIRTTLIHAGKNKTIGHPNAPLTEESLGHLQALVDRHNGHFVSAVARNRGVTPAVVNRDFGQGLVFGAPEAKRLGMVDRIDTLDDTVARLATQGFRAPRKSRAAAETSVARVHQSLDLDASDEPNGTANQADALIYADAADDDPNPVELHRAALDRDRRQRRLRHATR